MIHLRPLPQATLSATSDLAGKRHDVERCVRFVRHHLCAIVDNLRSGPAPLIEDHAWEALVLGFVEAVAVPLATEEDPDAIIAQIAAMLKEHVALQRGTVSTRKEA